MKKNIRIGTRGSPLALIQARDLRDKLVNTYATILDPETIEIVPIRTSGDWHPEQKERMLREMGGDKGLFTKELEDALLTGHVDIAVHSMKDVPVQVPDRLEIVAMLKRSDPRDAFVSTRAPALKKLPSGSSIGTCSLRRQAQILAHRPDLRVIPLRGNVDTRLRKLEAGEADATILALAGMQRLGVEHRVSSILETDVMLPAAGQGAVGIEIRRNEDELRQLLLALGHAPTALCVAAERAFLLAVDGSCQTPIGALAVLEKNGRLKLEVLAARPDGTTIIRLDHEGMAQAAATIGREAGEELKRRLPADFFTNVA